MAITGQTGDKFPSPCGVRRVRDIMVPTARHRWRLSVSVPLRGKEGAGRMDTAVTYAVPDVVSVPLRGKEGAGQGINFTKVFLCLVVGFRPLAG